MSDKKLAIDIMSTAVDAANRAPDSINMEKASYLQAQRDQNLRLLESNPELHKVLMEKHPQILKKLLNPTE